MTTQTNMTSETQPTTIAYSRLLWVTPLTILIATIANLGLYAAAGALFPEVTAWTGASEGQIIGANIAYLFIGAIVFAAVTRFSSRPVRNYLIVATIGLVFSLVMPISAGMGFGPPNLPSADMATVITLSLMHLLSYVISVPMFIRMALD